MIRAVIFDCFGVLYTGSNTVFYEQCISDQDKESLVDLNKQFDYGYIDQEEYIHKLSGLVGMSYDEVIAIRQTAHLRNKVLVEYIDSLRRSGYKVGLLSNVGKSLMDSLFSKIEQQQLFDAVLLSCDEHIAKPNPEIFTMMAEKINIPVYECVMVDDVIDNCAGAEFAGMAAICHISNKKTVKDLERLGVTGRA